MTRCEYRTPLLSPKVTRCQEGVQLSIKPKNIRVHILHTSAERIFYRDDDLPSPVERFSTGKEHLRTRLKILRTQDPAVPPVHGPARSGSETTTVALLPHEPSTVSAPRILFLKYISSFSYWLNIFHILSMALEGARYHYVIQNFRCNTGVGAWPALLLCVASVAGSKFLQFTFCYGSHVVPLQLRGAAHHQDLVDVMWSAAENRLI